MGMDAAFAGIIGGAIGAIGTGAATLIAVRAAPRSAAARGRATMSSG